MPVYFLWDRERNLVKIGWTRRDVDSRLAEHQSRAGGRLVLLKAIPGGRELERALHTRFSERRVPGTEFFVPNRELESVLGMPLCPEPARPTIRFLDPEPEPPAPSGPADHITPASKIGVGSGASRWPFGLVSCASFLPR